MQQLTPEQIESNWNKFMKLCETTLGDRSQAVLEMCEVLGERLALAPASSKTSHHCAFPGGLVEHSLRVLNIAHQLVKATGADVNKQSLVLVALFHDLGKLGYADEGTDYYVPQDSQWHRDKLGEMYKTNTDIPFLTVPHRSLFLLQEFGVKLTQEEYVAIMIHDGFSLQENQKYVLKEPMLATIISNADYMSTMQEKVAFKGE